ncbi:MAG TPA: hypothetical protein VFB12_05010 [Ktedonobacteraceae bacterium]|nr:hypothetical protein [Ktedonobacteraceae bacterium]
MDNLVDMIYAALEELTKQRFELPAFSTLDRLTGRIRMPLFSNQWKMVDESRYLYTTHFILALKAYLYGTVPSHSPPPGGSSSASRSVAPEPEYAP